MVSLETCSLKTQKYLKIMEGDLPEGVSRYVVYALVEKRADDLLTNRIYMMDVVLNNGHTYSFMQGYAGGGSFSENNFCGTHLVLEYSDCYSEEDEDFEVDKEEYKAYDRIRGVLDDGGCEYEEDFDVMRYSDLGAFQQYDDDEDMWILYRAWISDGFDSSIAEGDRKRFKTLVGKSGIIMSIKS